MGELSNHTSPKDSTTRFDLARGMAHTMKETKKEETAAWDDEKTRLQKLREKGKISRFIRRYRKTIKVISQARAKLEWCVVPSVPCVPKGECSAEPDAMPICKCSGQPDSMNVSRSALWYGAAGHRYERAMTLPDAKAAVEEKWDKLKNPPAWDIKKNPSQKWIHKRRRTKCQCISHHP